ncbi:YceI family protein [Mucilaginibacter sp. HMF5004]|uniref:YceI family protein n=1 Tax=Mucilaginibacter rivuli TaxID=2857527 RepID=UPI001C5F0173|nr:YceI family protein [Mucilaginibacter rivuli]MBW4891014.1 YceI family protein [Mucilaginibacter rivuli]
MKANYLTHRNTVRVMLITAITILFALPSLKAQTLYKLSPGPDVSIKVLGTSNVHDWTMASTGIDSKGEFKFDNGILTGLQSFNLSIDVKTLKSEHSSMDSRTYKAINANQYPKITYKLNSAVVTLIEKNKYLIKAKGELTIAGATQGVTLDVTAVVNADNSITCTGTEKLKLTDYKITPPSFMLGTMKVYNDLSIKYNLNYKK